MAFFHSFTDSIKQKWLLFFQTNRDWITLHMEVESVYTPDGGKRPPSYLILGVVNALEPKLAQLMLPFSRLNPDADTLIEVLDLHFDPDIALGNRYIPKLDSENYRHDAVAIIDGNLQDETSSNAHLNSFADAAVAQEFTIVDAAHQISNGLNGHNSKDESQNASSVDVDEFGEISFDTTTTSEIKLDDQVLEDLNSTDENAFSDVLSDVWGDETALQKGDGNNEFLGEELPAGVFDESEIARLFPNA
ncbi:DUF5331 domain-containing protein [Nostoc sp. 106C]|uniref:DUF5331 domain-containing protein n=1 Tax=Nostoc sp. 106C TaxID=1932667 RepID=UPI000A3AF6EC|nr:DUF5331 domain-containing protein [Nostoc sp. 106C]OUL20903.1 hypothetical protein BV375_30045 [Nostoc sp. 106C]OUL25083.1 hypothetical protein BV378_16045 [Nostoc sp. RF31YmG]